MKALSGGTLMFDSLRLRRNRKLPSRNSDNISEQLIVEEYRSLRTESIQSFQNAQSIIQWSLATYGVLFGAALVALSQDLTGPVQSFVAYASLIIFTFLIPGLVCAATWQWLGEITRMERVGVFLRGFETNLRQAGLHQTIPGLRSPLNWESFLAGGTRGRKRTAPYLGTAFMFGGSFCVSLIFAFVWHSIYFNGRQYFFPEFIWLIGGICIFILYVWVSVAMGVAVIKLGKKRYDMKSDKNISTKL